MLRADSAAFTPTARVRNEWDTSMNAIATRTAATLATLVLAFGTALPVAAQDGSRLERVQARIAQRDRGDDHSNERRGNQRGERNDNRRNDGRDGRNDDRRNEGRDGRNGRDDDRRGDQRDDRRGNWNPGHDRNDRNDRNDNRTDRRP